MKNTKPFKGNQRIISALQWAAFCPNGPFDGPNPQTAAQREGIRFERKVQNGLLADPAFPMVEPNPWIQFQDAAGEGWAQPDIITLPAEVGSRVLLVECKRTLHRKGIVQLMELYLPLICHLFPGSDVVPVLACRHAKRVPKRQRIWAQAELQTARPPEGLPLIWHLTARQLHKRNGRQSKA